MIKTVNPEVAAAAQALAAARSRLQKATALHEDATAKRAVIEGRIRSLETSRNEIIGRRQVGDCKVEDGPQLALIAADLEGLTALLGHAEAVVSDVTAPAEEARRALLFAEQHVQFVEDNMTEAALVEHARRLDGLMIQTVERINAIHKRRGSGTPKWGPSRALALELRKLQAARHEL
jgi:hypothetical protein